MPTLELLDDERLDLKRFMDAFNEADRPEVRRLEDERPGTKARLNRVHGALTKVVQRRGK
jgi:hypothetical protein